MFESWCRDKMIREIQPRGGRKKERMDSGEEGRMEEHREERRRSGEKKGKEMEKQIGRKRGRNEMRRGNKVSKQGRERR